MLILSISGVSLSANSGEISSLGAYQFTAKQVIDPLSTRKIEFCRTIQKKRLCEFFPRDGIGLFKGGSADWEKFFNYCKSFPELNTLIRNTRAATILATSPAAGVRLTGTLLSRALKVLGVVTTAEITADSSMYIPGAAFPEVDELKLYNAMRVIKFLTTSPKSEKIIISMSYLFELHEVLNKCSFKFDLELKQGQRRQCMGACHRLRPPYKGSNKKTTSPQPTILQNDVDSEIQDLNDYLKSVEN